MATAAVSRIKRKLPERISQVRGPRSQRQFARELGVFQQNVNRYENGTTPHTDFLITLATKENVSLDWLLLGKGKMKRPALNARPGTLAPDGPARRDASQAARRLEDREERPHPIPPPPV